MRNWYLQSVAALALVAGSDSALAQSSTGSMLLDTIEVLSDQGREVGVPTFEQQKERFIRRPGAETVVSVQNRDPGTTSNLRQVFENTPGVYTTDRTPGSSGFISIRGSDLAASGPRGGRGVRAYIDGIPLGRTDAGLTNSFLNINPAQYVEIFRGGSSLRYGSLSTGGAFNIVSKTGRSNPGSMISFGIGSYGYLSTVLETGGSKGEWDWFIQGSGYRNDGYQAHTGERTGRFDANFGYRPNEDFETRFYISAGSNNNDLAQTVRLDQLREQGRQAGTLNLKADTDQNFHYTRIANKTTMRFGDTTVEAGGYYLYSLLDHIPSPFAGMMDYAWKDYGVFGRVEHQTSLMSLPTEFVAGTRVNYTDGNFKQWTWANGGQDRGRLSRAWDFKGWVWENYGEAAIEVAPRLRTFVGGQAVYIKRDQTDVYSGGTFAAVNNPNLPNGPQPGRLAGKYAEFDLEYRSFNPKIGVNYEVVTSHFLFANVTRSFEAPTNSDVTDVLNAEKTLQAANPSARLPRVRSQSAWTGEIGVRGGPSVFQYDLTLYHMRLKDEILTRCATAAEGAGSSCATTIAFNADRTIHQGIEFGLKTIPFQHVFKAGDSIFVNGVYNLNDFRFDNDPRFGNSRMPVVPMHQVFVEAGYRLDTGFFVSGNVRYLSKRTTTFDGSGGDAFVVPEVALLGAKIGFKAPDGDWSAFIEGRNLTNELYVSDFSAIPIATGGSPSVRLGDGRAVYAGVSKRF